MNNVELYAKALEAIRSLAGDLSVEPATTAQNLDDLVEEINKMTYSLDLSGYSGPKPPTALPPTTLTIDGVNYIVVYGDLPDDKEAAERAVRQALQEREKRYQLGEALQAHMALEQSRTENAPLHPF